MVGNHDYDLGWNTDFAARLQAYNIRLDKSLVLIRRVGDKKIWTEHGQQHDGRHARVLSRPSAFDADVAQSAAAKCAIWSACAFTKDGRAVARAT
jgi:hypothetical protein